MKGLTLLGISLFGVTHAAAVGVFSIDLGSQRLVSVDSSNGQVTQIGTGLGLSRTVIDIDLTWHNGYVWGAAVYDTQLPSLLKIDPLTGAATSFDFTRPGNYFDYVEGLAMAGGKLIMTSIKTGGALSYMSDGIFELDFNGNVLSEFGYRSIDPGADFDCVEGLANGQLLVLDNEPSGPKKYQRVGATSVSYATINTFTDEDYAVNDWILVGNELVGINDYTYTVGRFDLATGSLLGTQALSTGASTRLRGAALNPVPEPATWAVLGFGAAWLKRHRARR